MRYFWHNIGHPIDNRTTQDLWSSLIEHGALTAGFDNKPGKGKVTLLKYQAEDGIFAYASGYGVLGFGRAVGPASYALSDTPRHGSDHRHEIRVRWERISEDIEKGIRPATLREKWGIHHPRSTSQKLASEAAQQLLTALRLSFHVVEASETDDLQAIFKAPDLSETEKVGLAKARLGQGRFRQALERKWGNRCALTGCDIGAILRASHIKPWCESNNAERLNPDNGLLLVANADALFDRGLISFSNDGKMIVAAGIDVTQLGLPGEAEIRMSAASSHFMKFHREQVFTWTARLENRR